MLGPYREPAQIPTVFECGGYLDPWHAFLCWLLGCSYVKVLVACSEGPELLLICWRCGICRYCKTGSYGGLLP